jgi:predicted kinase
VQATGRAFCFGSQEFEMEAVIFTGLQATGKSSFFKERFFSTHVRISLDLLRTSEALFAIRARCTLKVAAHKRETARRK